jgi:quinol monooxygenase YgiN
MFEATARLKIREGQLDGFKHQVGEIMRLTNERGTGPLRYDWFINDDATECELREAYSDADALLEHQRHIGQAKMALMRGFVADHTMTFYGDMTPALRGALTTMGVAFERFSRFDGVAAAGDVAGAVGE